MKELFTSFKFMNAFIFLDEDDQLKTLTDYACYGRCCMDVERDSSGNICAAKYLDVLKSTPKIRERSHDPNDQF